MKACEALRAYSKSKYDSATRPRQRHLCLRRIAHASRTIFLMPKEAHKISEWQPFDGVWIVQELEEAVSADPYLKEEPEALDELKVLLRKASFALVRPDPKQPKHIVYHFADPRRPLPRSGKSFSVYGIGADFLFDYLLDGTLASVEVRRHRQAPEV